MSDKLKAFQRRKQRTTTKLKQVSKPDAKRISVFRSNQHIYVQVIDDLNGKTLVSSSSVELKLQDSKANKVTAAEKVGADCAQKMTKAGISLVYFNKSGYKFHGRVKALADAMRGAGIKF